jgi:signal peptidase
MKTGGTSSTNLIKIALLSLAALLAVVIGTAVLGLFHNSSWWYLGFLAASLGLTWLLVGWRPRRSPEGAAASQIVTVYILFYLILIYLLGLVTGFLLNGYSTTPLMILRNSLPIIGITVLTELWRYALVKRIGDHRWSLVGIVVLFSLLTIVVGLPQYNLAVPLELFEMIGRLILGSIAANTLLTFVAYRSDFRPTLIYALIMAVYPVVLPILPDLGPFIYSVLAIMLPTLLFLRFNEFFVTKRPIPTRHQRSGRILWAIPAVAGLTVVVVLVSGIFRYWAMAIGSGSMAPAINTGDVVIIDKDYGEISQIELGTVLAFRRDGRIITHRLVGSQPDAGGLKLQTKGDSNDKDDAWTVRDSDVIGIIKGRIPIIGWPTVWLDRII